LDTVVTLSGILQIYMYVIARLQNPAEFRPDSVILPPELRNLQYEVPAFSGVSPLCHRSERDVLHDPPPLRTIPRPIREGLSIAFWASRLSEKLFSRKLTLSNFKLSFELKKKHRK
jgi:hypothetical protein